MVKIYIRATLVSKYEVIILNYDKYVWYKTTLV